MGRSWQTQAVLASLLEDVGERRYGLEMAKASGLSSGTVYPMLARLEREGLIAGQWEEVDPRKARRRPRRYYRLTRAGEQAARTEITTTLDRLLKAGATRRIAAIERTAQTDVGRNIGPLASVAAGNLLSAAAHLASAASPSIVILTGAYVPWASPPAAETDGPPGAAALAAGLSALGLPARLLTDSRCLPVVNAAARTATPEICVDKCDGSDEELEALAHAYRKTGVTHLIAIERMGPAADGVVRNFRGQDVTTYTAPLHPLMTAGPWTTIGIGDGGNELGMGNIPSPIISRAIKDGSHVHCITPCDYLIVSGVSNWGAIALLLATTLLRRRSVDDLTSERSWELHDRIVTSCVSAGAVDGTTGRPALTVDGVSLQAHDAIIDQMWTLAKTGDAIEKGTVHNERHRDRWRDSAGRDPSDIHKHERASSRSS